MQGAARAVLLVVAVIAAAGALVIVAIEPAIFGIIIALGAAIGWCRFLERSVHRPW